MTRSLNLALLAFGMLGGGVLTGKFNQPRGPDGSTRAGSASQQEKDAAQVLLELAAETGCTTSQAAINWMRQQSTNIIPILGARRLSQLKDNLGALEFSLSQEQLKRLSDINSPDPGFPHSFWNDYVRRDLIFGEKLDDLHLG